MRAIDADKLLRDIEKYHVSDGMFQHWVQIQQTIEPDIIRCKDCKWWAVVPNDDSELSDYRACYALKHCRTKAIDFCSRAERRTNT